MSTYPLPRIEDLFASLAGGKQFTKLDVAHAYLQIPLSEASLQYTTINTHKGLFRYNRMPFGISSAPSIYQKTMEKILQGVPRTSVYIDDILVTCSTTEEHLGTLKTVLSWLQQAGLKLKRNKCSFFATSIEFLGHIIHHRQYPPLQ
jgi:ribosome-interacting GTPase 1